jgi:hypothetical protein
MPNKNKQEKDGWIESRGWASRKSVAFSLNGWENEYEYEIHLGRSPPMSRGIPRTPLSPEQQAEAERIRQAVIEASVDDIRELAELLASKDDSNIFGATEFTVRDIVQRIGAKALQTVLEGRKKGDTKVPPIPVPTATNPPSSNAGPANPS